MGVLCYTEQEDTMSYQEFRRAAERKGFTHEQLRCNVPVSPALLEFMGEVGMSRYERFMDRMDREVDAKAKTS
jgi:hypothetical protein